MLSLMIDAIEGRDVATTDIVGAYLLADMDEYILIKLNGNVVDIMCKQTANMSFSSRSKMGRKFCTYGCERCYTAA